MESIRYVALGDSYTIGTGLEDEAQNFPRLLARRFGKETGIDVAVVNLGVNGYTTADLMRDELPAARGLRPEFVTILIGANDVVQGSSEAAYRSRLAEIYDALERLGLPGERVLAVSIPDFSTVPGAAPFGSASDLFARIEAFNGVARTEALSRGFQYIDITTVSREENHGNDWLARDNLHPGAAQHQAIADRIWEAGGSWHAIAWDRWSKSAERVLEGAQREAETLRHAYIGTEHLLLSVARDTQSAGGQLLKRRQVTYRKVRTIVNQVVGKSHEGEASPSRIIPTTRVRKVLRLASIEAGAAGAQSVGTEHILMALMVEGEGIAAHILSDFGVTPAVVRTGMDSLHDSAENVSEPRGAWSRLIGRLRGKP